MRLCTLIRTGIRTGALMLAGISATAQAAAPCVTQREAEALFLFMAPDLIRMTGEKCAATLPAASLLRRPGDSFIAKYRRETAGAWPLAKQALAKIAGPDAGELLESDFAAPMVSSLMAPMLTGSISPEDCPKIDRVLSLIEPLPARNTAALVVTLIELAGERKDSEVGERLPICPMQGG